MSKWKAEVTFRDKNVMEVEVTAETEKAATSAARTIAVQQRPQSGNPILIKLKKEVLKKVRK